MDRGRAVEHHRLRDRRVRRQAEGHLHPSRQVAQYQRYLLDTHPAFSDAGDRARRLRLPALRAARSDVAAVPRRLRDAPRDEPVVRGRPGRRSSRRFLDQRVAGPDEGSILERVAATAFKPHKRLLDHVARVIRNEPAFTLLDEQLVAYNAILDRSARPARTSRRSSSSSRAARAPASRSSRSTSSPSSPSSASGRSTSPARRHSPRTCARSSAAGGRPVQVLPRHRDRHRQARRRDPRRGAPDPDDQHEPLHAGEGAHGQGPDRRHPRLRAGSRSSSSTTCRSCARARSAAPT